MHGVVDRCSCFNSRLLELDSEYFNHFRFADDIYVSR